MWISSVTEGIAHVLIASLVIFTIGSISNRILLTISLDSTKLLQYYRGTQESFETLEKAVWGLQKYFKEMENPLPGKSIDFSYIYLVFSCMWHGYTVLERTCMSKYFCVLISR